MEKLLKCSTCKKEKSTSEFGVDNWSPRGYNYRCKSCISEWKKRPEVKEKNNRREAQYRAQGKNKLARRIRRMQAIIKLGGKCECCGETQIEFLAFDHINGLRGRGIKRNGGDAADSLALRINKMESPEKEFRILCHNCNSAHGFYGYCPHKTKKDFLTR
jgi:hypothetical protein